MEDLQTFMEFHVYAVWDFMSLLKALQQKLTCTQIPWAPPGNRTACRLINEIVLGEESDEDGQGGFISHYEMYLQAMKQAGANTEAIEHLLVNLQRGMPLAAALQDAHIPHPAREFVRHTFRLIDSGETHQIAAAFTLGREDLIPELFRRLVGNLSEKFPHQLDGFSYYLARHIELDEEQHGPLAERMLVSLCGDDEQKWHDAAEAASAALAARFAMWNAIELNLSKR